MQGRAPEGRGALDRPAAVEVAASPCGIKLAKYLRPGLPELWWFGPSFLEGTSDSKGNSLTSKCALGTLFFHKTSHLQRFINFFLDDMAGQKECR